MKTVVAGPWQFEVPNDWQVQREITETPYMEAADGTKGCYIKALTFGQPRASAREAADYLQGVHERNFCSDPAAHWRVVDRRFSDEAHTTRSLLDLYDAQSNYRVLSVVLAMPHQALQLALHDYACSDYDSSKVALAPVADSLRGPKTEA